MRLIFDIETNGLLDTLDKIHCIAALDLDSGARYRCSPADKPARGSAGEHLLTIEEGVRLLEKATLLIGHNIRDFDIPAVAKVFPWFTPKAVVRDTLLLSRLIYTDLFDRDAKFRRKQPAYPGRLTGAHSLEAWGWRLRCWKGDYAEVWRAANPGAAPGAEWAEWSQEMDDYCQQDVEVTSHLWAKLMSRGFTEESIELEHAVAPIIVRQQRHGFMFDDRGAEKLTERLVVRRVELEIELQRAFPSWYRRDGDRNPKRSARRKIVSNAGTYVVQYTEGAPYTAIVETLFNPGSRDHIADRLSSKYGWKPNEFTDGGKPKVDEDVLEGLRYPEAKVLAEYLLVCKRIGQVSEGEQAWLKKSRKGRIHGRVVQNGAVTGRMTHNNPNVAQVPKVGVPYGKECRALFIVPTGKVLVGADASGLELRCLAHFMAKWDDGAYATVILEGDIHSVNQAAAGLPTRDNAKTFIYAFLYGAGDAKIGSIIGKGPAAGRALKKRFLEGLPALGRLVKGVKEAAKKRGYLRGLDGRLLHVRSDHAALNTLLQSAGALVMKKALVILDAELQRAGFVPGRHYEFVANIHDEWQIECDEEIAEIVGLAAKNAIRAAGDAFGFRCPLDGEFKIGANWAETH